MSFVNISKLTFRYTKNQKPVIDHFSFEMKKGEIVGIVGGSGSGKSTLLRLVAGLETPESGNILIGQCMMVSGLFCMEVEKRGVGMVFQDYALFPHLTVADNVAFGLHKLPRAERKIRLQEMLDLVQLTDFANRYPHELSGGQQQRVALARSLAPKPSILLMDEPFSNLDTELKATIRAELREILRKANITCLFVSHDPNDIEAICDRSIRMGV
ncbi:MAG: ABC transporter ATP-binding protein [Candidatus Cohnella colombiensis]|uniref:ABC transporter ATP-binding protein n=1 Tax=Candidatus Cohnella colombiensis TaxID=3121368 RepID=A0AA95EZC8_9BACL|nr:MAG: ABC transporter ATP-binding protein [Cohnella sp.]